MRISKDERSDDNGLLKCLLCYNEDNLIECPRIFIQPNIIGVLNILCLAKTTDHDTSVYMSPGAAKNLFNAIKMILCAGTLIATYKCATTLSPLVSNAEYVWPILILGGVFLHKIAACEMPPYGNERL